MELLEEPRITRHLLTVDDYARMTETGVLAPDARVELNEGELIELASMGTRHHALISRLSRLLFQRCDARSQRPAVVASSRLSSACSRMPK